MPRAVSCFTLFSCTSAPAVAIFCHPGVEPLGATAKPRDVVNKEHPTQPRPLGENRADNRLGTPVNMSICVDQFYLFHARLVRHTGKLLQDSLLVERAKCQRSTATTHEPPRVSRAKMASAVIEDHWCPLSWRLSAVWHRCFGHAALPLRRFSPPSLRHNQTRPRRSQQSRELMRLPPAGGFTAVWPFAEYLLVFGALLAVRPRSPQRVSYS